MEETLHLKEKLLTTNAESLAKLERKLAEQTEQNKKLQASEKDITSQKSLLESKIKTLEMNLKQEKEKATKATTTPSSELIQTRKDKEKLESKVSSLECELQVGYNYHLQIYSCFKLYIFMYIYPIFRPRRSKWTS